MSSVPSQCVTVFAPASTGNVAVGFDILGFALEGIGDCVTVRRIESPEVRIKEITGCDDVLPLEADQNTATAGLIQLIEDFQLSFGFEVSIQKGIPLGSGMGGSAASAVGAIVAASALLDEPLSLSQRFHYAMIGEELASGGAHGDNIAPCLYGGLTLVSSLDPVRIVRIPVQPSIGCVLVHPHMRIDTREARQVIRPEAPLSTLVQQSSLLASLVAACFSDDLELLQASLKDVLIEPQRAALIPGFEKVQQAALEHGAFGCSISGAGPSVFAWYHYSTKGAPIRDAMVQAFKEAGLEADGWLSPVNALGAHVIS